jgi:hypothetical protein
MGRLAALGCAALLLGACSNDRPASAPPRAASAPPDAAPPPPTTTVPIYDPSTGLPLDDDDASRRTRGSRPRRILEITLRSTPSGALAAVDGSIIGRTPTLWEGEFTGQEREFTFVLPGYAIARYRFAPITSGVVHGRLDRATDGDAGVPEIPQPDLTRTGPGPIPVERAPRPAAPAAADAEADAAVEGTAPTVAPPEPTPAPVDAAPEPARPEPARPAPRPAPAAAAPEPAPPEPAPAEPAPAP